MKRKWLLVICLAVCACIFFLFAIIPSNNVAFSTDYSDYNSDKYPVYWSAFPSEIPENATVAAFSYYNYWEEDLDIYLELRFDTTEEMELYLTSLTDGNVNKAHAAGKDNSWFVKEQSVHDGRYTDMFLTEFTTTQNNKNYVGYSVKHSDGAQYHCNFQLLSYSYEELTVVHTYVRGTFIPQVNKHTPYYFLRFGVPIHENYERKIYVE